MTTITAFLCPTCDRLAVRYADLANSECGQCVNTKKTAGRPKGNKRNGWARRRWFCQMRRAEYAK